MLGMAKDSGHETVDDGHGLVLDDDNVKAVLVLLQVLLHLWTAIIVYFIYRRLITKSIAHQGFSLVQTLHKLKNPNTNKQKLTHRTTNITHI